MLSKELKAILDEFSPDNALHYTRTIGEQWPNRLSGTKSLEESAQFIVEELQHHGLENATLQEFDGLISIPTRSELKVLEPETRYIDSRAFAQIGNTSDEGVETELVFVGAGGFPNYDGTNVKGKIVLAELSYAPPRPEKVRIATLKEAAGIIICNWGPSDSDIIPLGTVKSVWGNPTPENVARMDVIPAIGISRKDGEYLIRLCEKGKVKVNMVAQATREWKKLYQPWARIQGTSDQEKFIIVGGHTDSWAQGITDNASGDALRLEIARILAKHRDKLRRSVEFVFWVGHENAIMAGSTWYVDGAWDRLNANGLLYINVDSPGMKGTSRYVAWSSPETFRWHSEIDQETVSKVDIDRIPLSKVGDQSFFGVGIPSVFGLTMHTREEIQNWQGAILGTWYHSEQDTMDVFDLDLLAEAFRPIMAYILDICTRLVLPFEYMSVAEEFIGQLQEYQAAGGKHLDLNDLIVLSSRLKTKAQVLDYYGRMLETEYCVANDASKKRLESKAELVNQCLMRLGRVLTRVRAQVADRYDQDTYGLSALHKSVPILYDIGQLAQLDPFSQDFKLLKTRLTRQRNRVADALSNAIWQIDNTMQLLAK
jgi:Iap family predicted aminopeptidase